MGLLSRLKQVIDEQSKSGADSNQLVQESRDPNEDFRKHGYRQISNSSNSQYLERDLTPYKQDKMQRISKHFWRSSPIARRLIDIKKNLIISEGFDFKAKGPRKGKNKRLEQLFLDFWRTNSWDTKLEKRIQDLLIFGELIFYCAPMNQYTGRMKMTYFHPENVETILPDPFDVEELDKVIMNVDIDIVTTTNGVRKNEAKRLFNIIRERPTEDGEMKLSGDVFYYGINCTSASTRGMSDLIQIIDWLDIEQKILRSETERIEFTKAFIYKCRVEGGEQNVQNVLERHKRPPNPASVLVHTDKEEWSVIAPQMTLFDTVAFSKHMQQLIFGGAGVPEHWFSSNGDINRATSTSMDDPVFIWTRKAKADICNLFTLMFSYYLQEAREGILSDFEDADCDFEIISRDADRAAYLEIAKTIAEMGNALNIGISSGWWSNDYAAHVMRKLTEQLGLGESDNNDISNETNWNVEVVKAKAEEDAYKGLQRMEGKANLIGRLFQKDVVQGVEQNTGDAGFVADTALGKFLQNAIDLSLKGAKDKATADAEQKDKVNQAVEKAKAQIQPPAGAVGNAATAAPKPAPAITK